MVHAYVYVYVCVTEDSDNEEEEQQEQERISPSRRKKDPSGATPGSKVSRPRPVCSRYERKMTGTSASLCCRRDINSHSFVLKCVGVKSSSSTTCRSHKGLTFKVAMPLVSCEAPRADVGILTCAGMYYDTLEREFSRGCFQ